MARDGDRCWYCGCAFGENGEATTIDHVQPLGEGGRSLETKLRLACATCNIRKSGQSVTEFVASEFLRRRRSEFEPIDGSEGDEVADTA